jgi:hypothetical protein
VKVVGLEIVESRVSAALRSAIRKKSPDHFLIDSFNKLPETLFGFEGLQSSYSADPMLHLVQDEYLSTCSVCHWQRRFWISGRRRD